MSHHDNIEKNYPWIRGGVYGLYDQWKKTGAIKESDLPPNTLGNVLPEINLQALSPETEASLTEEEKTLLQSFRTKDGMLTNIGYTDEDITYPIREDVLRNLDTYRMNPMYHLGNPLNVFDLRKPIRTSQDINITPLNLLKMYRESGSPDVHVGSPWERAHYHSPDYEIYIPASVIGTNKDVRIPLSSWDDDDVFDKKYESIIDHLEYGDFEEEFSNAYMNETGISDVSKSGVHITGAVDYRSKIVDYLKSMHDKNPNSISTVIKKSTPGDIHISDFGNTVEGWEKEKEKIQSLIEEYEYDIENYGDELDNLEHYTDYLEILKADLAHVNDKIDYIRNNPAEPVESARKRVVSDIIEELAHSITYQGNPLNMERYDLGNYDIYRGDTIDIRDHSSSILDTTVNAPGDTTFKLEEIGRYSYPKHEEYFTHYDPYGAKSYLIDRYGNRVKDYKHQLNIPGGLINPLAAERKLFAKKFMTLPMHNLHQAKKKKTGGCKDCEKNEQNMKKYDEGGDKKSIMFLDKNKNKNQKVNLNLRNFRNVKNPDLANALSIGGATLLGSTGLRNLSTNRRQNKAWEGAYSDYTGALGGQEWIDRVNDLYCADGTCPAIQENLEQLLGTHSGPDLDWFKDEETNVLGKSYHMGRHNVLSKEDLRKQKTKNILKGGRDALIAGGGSYLLNKALDNTRWGRNLQNKLGMDINLGIFRGDGGQRAKEGGVKKYATAGMYDANVIPGSMNSTTNIVMQQSDPSVLAANQQGLQSVVDKLNRESDQVSSEISNIEANSEKQIEEAANKVSGSFDAAETSLQKGTKWAEKQGWFDAASNIAADKTADVFSLGLETVGDKAPLVTPSIAPPVENLINIPSGGGSMDLISSGSNWGNAQNIVNPYTQEVVKQGSTLGADALASTVKGAGKWAGFGSTGLESIKGTGTLANMGKWATSGAGLGTIASLAGKGIKKLSDDDKAYHSNVGEYSGAILGAAGSGASIGSMIFPGVGTAIGAGVGALYGAGKQFFATQAAKREKEQTDALLKQKTDEHNQLLSDQMGSQLAKVRSGELDHKTYSGYDLGRNITAAYGGLRMPRYAY